MGKTYNGRFDAPKKPDKGGFWLVLGLLLILFGHMPGIVLGILSIVKYVKMNREYRLYERFFKYCAVIGQRKSVPVRELARASGRSVADARQDLQTMVGRGYFGDSAYLDVNGGCLVLGDGVESTAGGWKDAVLELIHAIRSDFGVAAQPGGEQSENAQPKPEEPQPQKETCQNTPPKNVKRTYMDELERTLNELYQLNMQIEDEAVSGRIDRIGELTGGIFRAVIENPEREGDVRKFMNYYLPTTLKLLRSYELMEEQSYQGENILASRKKIENVLDMLIAAYEKQLDRLFRNDALDIATDIDVLETMMAGDGLSSKGTLRL